MAFVPLFLLTLGVFVLVGPVELGFFALIED